MEHLDRTPVICCEFWKTLFRDRLLYDVWQSCTTLLSNTLWIEDSCETLLGDTFAWCSCDSLLEDTIDKQWAKHYSFSTWWPNNTTFSQFHYSKSSQYIHKLLPGSLKMITLTACHWLRASGSGSAKKCETVKSLSMLGKHSMAPSELPHC